MHWLIVLLPVFGVTAAPTPPDPTPPAADSTVYTFNEESDMTVYGTSNVRDWTMDVTTIDGRVVLDTTASDLPSIQKIEVSVPVDSMVSDKDRLQRHAHEALKKEDHPTVSFTASDVSVAAANADSFSVVANGDLTIAGETRAVDLTAKGVQRPDGTIAVTGEHRLKLSTFKVERPSLFFGAIKVDDPIRLGFTVLLRRAPSPISSSE